MAFGQGKVSSESTGSFKRYVGVAAVKVLAVNPTKDEWEKITGSTLQKEPEYTTAMEDGTKVAKVTLLVQPDPMKTIGAVETVIPVTFWFRRRPVQGSKSGKYQIIDKYGRTAWATEEEIAAKKVPQYANGPADIDADYRKIVDGEEAFTNFLKAHLNIPSITFLDKNGVRKTNEHPEECEARLDNILKIFDGNFKEIETILGYQKDNYSKMLFGVKTTDDGKEYQDVFMGLFLTNRNPNTGRFATALKAETDLGRYSHTYFGEVQPNGEIVVELLHERVVAPTEFKENTEEMPFGAITDTAPNTFDASSDDMPF